MNKDADSMRVLIVEDELLIAYAIKRMLEPNYTVVDTVVNYEDAIKVLESKHIDIALLDVNLAGKSSGMDLAVIINKHYKIPFIFLTALSQPIIIDKLLESHPAGYLSKPINKADLYAVMHLAFLNQKKDDEIIEILVGKKTYRIDFKKLMYIESDHIYTHIHTDTDNDILRISVSNFVEQTENRLRRINRKIAINEKFIKSESSTKITLINNQTFSISKKY